VKRLLIALVIAGCLTGQSVVTKFTVDLAGSGAAVQVVATSTPVKQAQFIATGTGTARCGGSSVTSSSGSPLPAGAGQFLPPLPLNANGGNQFYDLSTYYCYVPTGLTVSVTGWN
jgi:type 1 fimbria pilin